MKKIVAIFLMFLFSIPLYAEDIVLEPKDKFDGSKRGDRTELIIPSACIEDGVLTIESDMATHGVVVAIYDSSNALVYTSVSEIESSIHEFVVGILPAGDYTLDVQVGDTLASGDFTIL